MNWKVNKLQSILALRALAVIIVMLLTATTALAEAETVEVKYIDENGIEQTVKATVLTGGQSKHIGPGWFVCNTSASENDGKGLCYTGLTEIEGDTKLILADGCKMTYEGSQGISGWVFDGSLTIYGQREGSGMFIAKNTDEDNYVRYFLFGNDLIINGGQLTLIGFGLSTDGANVVINGGSVKGENCGELIFTRNGNIIINGGTVETSGYGVYALRTSGIGDTSSGDIIINGGIVIAKVVTVGSQWGIYSEGNVIINGGKVEAEARNPPSEDIRGIRAGKSIILSWTNATDYVKSFGYDDKDPNTDAVVKIPAGKGFLIDGTTTVIGGTSGTDFSISDIVGKKLTPTNVIPTDGNQFIAFSDINGNRKITDAHAQVYIVTGYNLTDGEVYLKPVDGNVIPKGLPMVIGHITDGTALPGFLAIADDDALTDDALAAVKDGMLKGFVACDGSKTVQNYLDESFGEGVSASDYIPYLLTGGSFKSVLVSASDVIKRGTCLLFIPKWDVLMGNSAGSKNAATRSIDFGGDGATAIDNSRQAIDHRSEAWYDLQGRRLSGKPTRKGLYIRNGKLKVVN